MARANPAPVATATHPLPPPPGPRHQRLLQVLREARRELSAQELHQLLESAQEQQGLATVYRGLKLLQCAGLVRWSRLAKVLLQGFQPLFHTFEIHGLWLGCQRLQAAGHG